MRRPLTVDPDDIVNPSIGGSMNAHLELLKAIKDYLAKKEAYDSDVCPENWNQFCDADQRLAAAIESSEKEI
jgi:hypothetical protein